MLNHTLNGQVQISPLEHLSLAGDIFSISKRWTAIANDGTATFLMDVRSDWFNFTFEVNATGTFHFDVWLISSYSGGTPMLAANRNFIFQGVRSLTSNLLADPVIEVQVSSNAAVELVIPGGGGPHAPGGSFEGSVIHFNPGRKIMMEFTNKAGTAQDLSILILAYENMINSIDWLGK